MKIIVFSKDLMFASALSHSAEATDSEIKLVSNDATLAEKSKQFEANLVILDLVLCEDQTSVLIAAIQQQQPSTRIIAYGPHVAVEQLNAASAAGADLVLTRGEFHARMNEIIAASCTAETPPTE